MKSAREFTVGKLKVKVFENRILMSKELIEEVTQNIQDVLSSNNNGRISILFASSPYQEEFLDELVKRDDVEWEKIIGFHMDEFVGLDRNSPGGFGNYLLVHLGDKIDRMQFHYIDGKAANTNDECERYAKLIEANPFDIAFAGIGENGHIAFNDPHIADFNDPKLVKINEEIDPICRQQQVKDELFKTSDDVPDKCITVTIPPVMNSKSAYIVVPGKAKADIIKRTLEGPISVDCPGSILRKHENAILYLDNDSAAKLDTKLLGEK